MNLVCVLWQHLHRVYRERPVVSHSMHMIRWFPLIRCWVCILEVNGSMLRRLGIDILSAVYYLYISQTFAFVVFLAATKQLYKWYFPSVCPSHLLTMFPSSYHHEILRSYYQWQKWCPCKRSRSKVKVTEVITQLSLFRTVTPFWIHIWWWNDA